ncbi:MAG: hypothetical protein ABTQ31_04740 [Rhizobiaceae bacterium]
MIRFLFRLAASVALAVAVIMAVIDTTRTVAAGRLVKTPLSASLEGAWPGTSEALRAFLTGHVHALAWNPVATFVIAQPGFAVFGVLAFLLYAVGRRRQRRVGDFAVEI